MSYLRDIMQKLAEASAIRNENATQQGKGLELLKLHVDAYQTKLESCSKAMLQYEWAWWREHIETLELCLTQPDMHEGIGGKEHVERLLEESRACLSTLTDVMKARMVNPAGHSYLIHPSEHAWELSQETMRREWKII